MPNPSSDIRHPTSDIGHLKLAIECLLFVCPEPLPRDRLLEVVGADGRTLNAAIAELREDLAARSLMLVEVAGGFQLKTRPEFAHYVRALLTQKPERISRAALEVLAIVAYRQPITRPEVDAIRGVNSSAAIEGLVEKGLVHEVGRKPAPGRPMLYRTTRRFLEIAGLPDLSELPPLGLEADALQALQSGDGRWAALAEATAAEAAQVSLALGTEPELAEDE